MQLVASGEVIHAGTMNSGNPSIAAALATIEVLERDNTHQKLFDLGEKLMRGLTEIGKQTGHQILVQGLGPMFHVGFTTASKVNDLRDTFAYDKAQYSLFTQGMQERGIRLIGRGLWYISNAHNEADIELCLEMARQTLQEMKPQ